MCPDLAATPQGVERLQVSSSCPRTTEIKTEKADIERYETNVTVHTHNTHTVSTFVKKYSYSLYSLGYTFMVVYFQILFFICLIY